MEGKRLSERFHIVISAFGCLIGGMYTNTEIGSDDEHGDIET